VDAQDEGMYGTISRDTWVRVSDHK